MYIYNPLLKENLQKAGGAASVVSEVSQIQNLKIGAIFQYIGETTEQLTNGYFYKKKGEAITIPAGFYWLNVDTGEHYILTKTYTAEEAQIFNKSIPVGDIQASDNEYYLKILSLYSTQNDINNIKNNALITRQSDKMWFKATNITINNDSQITQITLSNDATITPNSNFQGANIYGEYTCLETNNIYYSSVADVNNEPNLICNINNTYDYGRYLFATEPIGSAFSGSKQHTNTELIILNVEQINVQPTLQGVNFADGELLISVNTNFAGDVTVQGKQTTVITQEIDSENDNINLRYNNPLALAENETSGLNITNYDGNGTTLKLAVDKQGWGRIGDENGILQKIATIEDNATNNDFVTYNTTTKQLESKQLDTSLDINSTNAVQNKVIASRFNTYSSYINSLQIFVHSINTYTINSDVTAYRVGRLCQIVGVHTSSTTTITLNESLKPVKTIYNYPGTSSYNAMLGTDGKLELKGGPVNLVYICSAS